MLVKIHLYRGQGIRATKDIRAGEELLLCYEPLYRFNINYGTNNLDKSNHPMTYIQKIILDPDYCSLISNVNKFFCQ